MSSATAPALSVECPVGREPDYADMHTRCRQIEDVPLPHGRGILLVPRRRCSCRRRQSGVRASK
ncbi:hypothetical protein [Streptomyces sp. GQFP]|uniref:hypothetical protein n=1 Tax=Streptomyces sp. GQFP TaxID=2907545 RepID=UPI001F2FCB84|nr:hypothetical protein [Streptomyces sp. GQFP]UIX33204.1 hypothetical protein LUX31_26095 [Streptomyces sp. GQFP]